MGKKISFKKYAKVCMDYVNRDNQNCIWGFKKENLPDPSKVFNLHAAEKIAAEKKKSLPKIETCRTIKLKNNTEAALLEKTAVEIKSKNRQILVLKGFKAYRHISRRKA